jgi:hypothetical protein
MRSASNTKTKPSSSRGRRSGSKNAAPDGEFVELRDGGETEREALGDGLLNNRGNNRSLSRIEVVDEVWVHWSPRGQESIDNVQ